MTNLSIKKIAENTTTRLVVAGLLILFGLFVLTHQSSSASQVGIKVDLIAGHDWSHFAGAAVDDNKILITPLDRSIVNQDGTFGQHNSPVNIRGPYLKYSGDIAIKFSASDITNTSSAILDIYGSVPGVYDEWLYVTPRVRAAVASGTVTLDYWDGNSSSPVSTRSWQASTGSNAEVTLIRKNNNLLVSLNGRRLGQMNTKALFTSNQIWFGADATAGSAGWHMNSLSVTPQKKSNVQVIDGSALGQGNDVQGLRTLAQINSRHLPIGAAISSYALFSDSDYRHLAGTQFSMLTPENELKPQFVHPSPNTYSFTDADSLVEFAKANDMQVHGHTLVFSEANPLWMQNSAIDQRQSIMTNHIATVIGHYIGQINEWDVVNEPLSDNDNNSGDASDLRDNIWKAAMGEQYIDMALQTARNANPDAKLYINEYGLEADGDRWEEFVALLQRLQDRGVPLDGVGFQSHVYESGDEIDPAVLEQHMQFLASMGLASRISEIDVHGDDPSLQASQYTEALKACLAATTCTSFSTWGISDRYGSTTEISAYPLEFGDDLLWNSLMQPKLAQSELSEQLKN